MAFGRMRAKDSVYSTLTGKATECNAAVSKRSHRVHGNCSNRECISPWNAYSHRIFSRAKRDISTYEITWNRYRAWKKCDRCSSCKTNASWAMPFQTQQILWNRRSFHIKLSNMMCICGLKPSKFFRNAVVTLSSVSSFSEECSHFSIYFSGLEKNSGSNGFTLDPPNKVGWNVNGCRNRFFNGGSCAEKRRCPKRMRNLIVSSKVRMTSAMPEE